MHGSGLFGNPFGGLFGLSAGLGLGGMSNAFSAEAEAFRKQQIFYQAACQKPEQSDFDNGEIIDVEGREVIPGEKRIENG